MKLEFIVSFAVAAVVHAVLLLGFRLGSTAQPLLMRDDSSPVDVSLVEAGPPPESVQASQSTPAPSPTPEAMPTPIPEPTPAPMPLPEPIQTLEPAEAPVVEPPHENPKPPPPARKAVGSQRTSPAPVSSGVKMQGPTATVRARYRSNPRPEYPIEARQRHQQGVVLLSVEVGADGRVIDVSLKRSSGVSSLDEAAMRAVHRWTFEPARAGGLPVASRADVPVRFSLAE